MNSFAGNVHGESQPYGSKIFATSLRTVRFVSLCGLAKLGVAGLRVSSELSHLMPSTETSVGPETPSCFACD